jgi:hypothetical protein
MKINVNQKITDLEGNPIPGNKKKLKQNGNPIYHKDAEGDWIIDENNNKIPVMQSMTLKEAIINALLAGFQDEANIPGTKKLERFMLAEKINKADSTLELITEEIVEIKAVVGKMYFPLIIGKVYGLLENPGGKK